MSIKRPDERFSHHTYAHAGIRMHYVEAGEGTPILFLHGVGASISVYSHVLEFLADNHKVYAPDLPFHGLSDTPKGVWGLDEFGAFFSSFLEDKHLANVTVIGHSFGGGIALHLASISQRIGRLILLNPAGTTIENNFWHQMYLFMIKMPVQEMRLKGDKRVLNIMGREFLRNITRNVRNLPLIIKIVRRSLWGGRADFKSIKVKTTILWGKHDVLFPVAYAQRLADEIPDGELILIDGTHSWSILQPQTFLKHFYEAMEKDGL